MKAVSIKLCCIIAALFFATSLFAKGDEAIIQKKDSLVDANKIPYSEGQIVDGYVRKRAQVSSGVLSQRLKVINNKSVDYEIKKSTIITPLKREDEEVSEEPIYQPINIKGNTLIFSVPVDELDDVYVDELNDKMKAPAKKESEKTLPASIFKQNAEKK